MVIKVSMGVCVCDSAVYSLLWSQQAKLIRKSKHNLLILELFGIMVLWVVARSLQLFSDFNANTILLSDSDDKSVSSANVSHPWPYKKRLFWGKMNTSGPQMFMNSEENKIIRCHNKQSTQDVRMLQWKIGFVSVIFSLFVKR